MLQNIFKEKHISNREMEVISEVTKGQSNKEVANVLFVTEKTVKFHLTSIFKKLGLKSRAQLIVWSAPHLKIEEPAAMEVKEPETKA